MSRALDVEFISRLHRLAIDFLLPSGPSMSEAIVLAEDLVAAGDEGPATVAVAALPRDTTRSDAEDDVLGLLAEHEIDIPAVQNGEQEYRMLLKGFACWGLPAHHFVHAYWGQLPDWDEQTPLDRELASLLELQDAEHRPSQCQVIEGQMRAAARASLASTEAD